MGVEEKDLIEIKRFLARYFAQKTMKLADKVWDEKGWTEDDMIRMANTKMRATKS